MFKLFSTIKSSEPLQNFMQSAIKQAWAHRDIGFSVNSSAIDYKKRLAPHPSPFAAVSHGILQRLSKQFYFLVINLIICFSIQAAAFPKSAATHCKPDEKTIFSCLFKNRKTASICGSGDLSRDKGTAQYRYGVVGRKVELVYPNFEDEKDPIYNHPARRFSLFATRSIKEGDRSDLSFSPFSDDPSINFFIDARVGPLPMQKKQAHLSIIEVHKSRDKAHFFCIHDQIIDHIYEYAPIFKKNQK